MRQCKQSCYWGALTTLHVCKIVPLVLDEGKRLEIIPPSLTKLLEEGAPERLRRLGSKRPIIPLRSHHGPALRLKRTCLSLLTPSID